MFHKSWMRVFNSLAHQSSGSDFTSVLLKLISWIDILTTSFECSLRWMLQNAIDDKSTLVWVMAWCHQAISLNKSWPSSVMPHSITRPQWVNTLFPNIYQYCKWWQLKCEKNVFAIRKLHCHLLVFYLCLNKDSATKRSCYICNIFHWLRPSWAITRKWALLQSDSLPLTS